MRGALLALGALLAACSSPTRSGGTGPVVAPAKPAPRVVRGGLYGLITDGMPAIAADGSRIVAGFRESDGERGLPNMTLVVKDRADAEVARHVVLSIAEADGMLDDADGNNPALDERVARANAWLADLHREHRFVALTHLQPEVTLRPADRRRARRGPLEVTWAPNRLQIRDGGTVLVDRETPPTWIPQDFPEGSAACVRSPYLGAAAIDRVRKLAVVTISTVTDSDACLPAPDQHHVIVW